MNEKLIYCKNLAIVGARNKIEKSPFNNGGVILESIAKGIVQDELNEMLRNMQSDKTVEQIVDEIKLECGFNKSKASLIKRLVSIFK